VKFEKVLARVGVLRQTQTTYISVGDHPALRQYHDDILDLDGEGNWAPETVCVNGQHRPGPPEWEA